jgi:hypothetical protein
MIKNIEKIMEQLAKGSDKIIVNPSTLEELKHLGVPLDVIPAPTIDELFEERKKKAHQKLPQLPALPKDLPPAIQALYQEIRECIFFGLNGAAITMSSILIEFVLKHVTFIKESGGYQKADPQQWDHFEKMELGPAIKRAKKAGLIDFQMEKKLDSFRKTIRNPYNHFNIKKLTQDVVAKKVKVVNTENGAIEERDMPAKDNPMIQAQVKPVVDEYNVIPVFYFADEAVKYLLPKIK